MDKELTPFTPDWNKLLEKLEAYEQSAQDLSPEEQLLLAELRALRDESANSLNIHSSFNTNKKWAELKEQIGVDLISHHRSKGNVRKLWISISAAAAAILIITGISLLYVQDQQKPQNLVNIIKNDIAPGKNTATLTLDNGKKIVLSAANKGQLASEAGIVISKTADGQVVYSVENQDSDAATRIHMLSTAKGETYRLRLPDQSEVWLNASSSIKFPASFASQKLRQVELTGEAYFEIAKDKAHPFIVKTNQQEVQVLGTHFNINSYSDKNNTTTTLLEGSLRILNNARQGEIIKPGEQSLLQADHHIIISQADIKNVMAWKNGYFRFRNEPIEDVMEKIIRWYNIDVIYEGKVSNEKFNGNISRNKNISEVLNMLSYSNAVKFKVDGRRVTVMQ